MFREEYIKANEQIRPDDVFLERLKESVREDKVLHIGDYVDYNHTETFEDIGSYKADVSTVNVMKKKRVSWKKGVALAACFTVVCVMAAIIGKMDLMTEEKGLQAGIESIVNKDSGVDNMNDALVDETCQKQYDKMHDMFAASNVIIYEVDDFEYDENQNVILPENQSDQFELSIEQRDELVGNIVAKKYILCDTCEDFSNAIYYIAQFEDDSCICFVVDKEQYIYIESILELQSLANSTW